MAFFLFGPALNAALGQAFVTNSYSVSNEDFANPERGFSIQSTTYASAPSPVYANLASFRTNGLLDPGGLYTAKIALVQREYYLDTFVTAPISASFLAAMQTDFDFIRAQGCKAVLRFAYNTDTTRPLSEPSKTQILAHIAQIQPLLKQNSDVIAVLQEGFIGAWGEGYYTDVFYTNGQATAQNWRDRADVLTALLAALPAERMIQVRTPQMKQKYVYGAGAPTSSAPLSSSNAFNGTSAARLGFCNDCYLSSSTDTGTFVNYDWGAGTSAQDTSNLRNYLAMEARYAPMGGETCALYAPTSDCGCAGGNADVDMAFAHWSFLNQGYNAVVDDKWVAQGCIEDIKRRLGYRLQLISGVFRSEAQPGQAIPLTLQFQNTGYAAPFNPRGLELVLRNTASGQKFFAALSRDTDLRRWLPGTNYVLSTMLSLPSYLPVGAYEVLLNLPDPAPSLYGNIAFSIRMANSNALSSAGASLGAVWESTTGYHHLGYTLTVNATATNSLPNGTEIPVRNYSAISIPGALTNLVHTIVIDGSFDDWQGVAPLYSSPSNSSSVSNLKDIYVCNDSNYIYFMVTAWNPSTLVSAYNNFYFDTDNNGATGYATSKIGSELLVQNGAGYQEKAGSFNAGNVNGLQFLSAPSVPASQFEFRLSRFATNASDGAAVFKTNLINFSFEAQNSSWQTVKRIPSSGAISYALAESPPGPLSVRCLAGSVLISWPGSGTLQSCASLSSPSWTNVPGTSPYSVSNRAQQYFRLAR